MPTIKNPRDPSPTNHSTLLVGIADQLNDSPLGVVHRHLAPAFNIVISGLLGGMVLLRGIARRYADCFHFPLT
ncbi:hypothetical protein MTR67_023031 [Solanum verrucosum]|uniref:Uncharacterized protein n=1 Tax=Solanum verrucosum TaxID=315347 RepID=A0AAF0TRG3_SOLVR|nr:hypothetical protein MTR67_023031 [Solanum verrucosum]